MAEAKARPLHSETSSASLHPGGCETRRPLYSDGVSVQPRNQDAPSEMISGEIRDRPSRQA